MTNNPFEIVNGASPGFFAGAPYGDLMEVTGPPRFIFVEEPYSEFFRTDARSVLIVVHPHHYNFIPNPAFRTGLTNWEFDGVTATLNENEAWVGQSVVLTGTGTARFRRNGYYVYVGPVGETESSHGEDWNQHGRSSAQWTFSAFLKGTGRARLVMDAYSGGIGDTEPPFGFDFRSVADPGSEPYSDDEYLLDSDNGSLWMRRPAPYHQDLGRPPVVADPANHPGSEPFLLDGAANLWQGSGSPTVYTMLGPTSAWTDDPALETDNPATMPPGAAKYLLVSAMQADGTTPDPSKHAHVWARIDTPYYTQTEGSTTIAKIVGQWVDLRTEDWTRLYVQTQARYTDSPSFNFGGCRWIDARIEVEDAADLTLSAVMLDPTEWPISQYFDGGMTEDAANDDFMWDDPETPDDCVSEYYYDRVARVRWMYENLQHFVPVGRPYQIYFGDTSRPYIPTGARTRSTRNFAL